MGLNNFSQNDTSLVILDYLDSHYRRTTNQPKLTFLSQLDKVKDLIGSETFERAQIISQFSTKKTEFPKIFQPDNSYLFISEINKLLIIIN